MFIFSPNSIVNKKINEDPAEYKFVCTLHDGKCKKFFKTEKVRLRDVTIDFSGDKIYTGDMTGGKIIVGEAFSPVNTLKKPDFELIFTVCNR